MRQMQIATTVAVYSYDELDDVSRNLYQAA